MNTPHPTRRSVATWADGFGVWHARVIFPQHGYGNTGEHDLDRHWDSIRQLARRAIRREIVAREATHADLTLKGLRVAIEVEAQGIHASSNIWYSVTFKETGAHE